MNKTEFKYLVANGLTFPTCEEELLAYDKQYKDEVYELSEDAIDPYKILKKVNVSKKAPIKISLNRSQSYFRRAVLAAKIADEFNDEWTFGVVKFQKLVYLAEQTSRMKFASDYRKQAAGPMDHKFIHSIKKEFEKQGWFTVHQEGQYRKWVFTPQENLKGYQSYYLKYYSDVNEDIQFLIDSFKKWKTDKVELIATIFACWLEAKEDNNFINDAHLIQRVYAWHKTKEKFSEKNIIASIRWMEENGVYPK